MIFSVTVGWRPVRLGSTSVVATATLIIIARLLAAAFPHSRDWLHAPQIALVGLRLSDETVRVAVAHRLGWKACEPHTCPSGKAVDTQGLHGLCCRRSGPRQQHHHQMNDIVWRAIKRAQLPATKEPVSLIRWVAHRSDCQRSMLSFKQGSNDQGCKVWHAVYLSHLFASGSWNHRHLKPVHHRADPGNW